MAMVKWLWISGAVIVLDQLTKYWAQTQLELHRAVEVLPFLNWTLSHNPGAAFSFLADQSGWQRWFFTVIAFAVSVGLIVWLTRLQNTQRWLAIALTLVIGGAIGNVIDRMLHGYVIDFIDVYYKSYHWPAFNIADSAIFVGAVMLIIDSFKNPSQEKKANE